MVILRKNIQLSEFVMLGGLAICVGLASGAEVWLFKWSIDQVNWLAFDQLGDMRCRFAIYLPKGVVQA